MRESSSKMLSLTTFPGWFRSQSSRSRRQVFRIAHALLCLAVTPCLAGAEPEGSDPVAPATWVGDLSPIAESDWSYARAAHLIERAGFGATPADIQRLEKSSPQAVVDWLVDYESIDNSSLEPFDDSEIFDPGMDPFPTSRADAVRIARENGEALGVKVLPEGSSRPLQPVVDKFFYGLRADVLETRRLGLWWSQRMLSTARPLEEKLTFFWHGHFATSDVKVRDYRMMRKQNEMLRSHANGNFRDLLLGVMRDPAMLIYLDNGENVKDHPNENFGRELLELFTMGVGNYTEKDIREASRAFTGWTNDVLDFRFAAHLHDAGSKTFLAHTGNLGGEEIIDIILEQPATAEFIAAKLYRFFVREEISPTLRTALGRRLRNASYELKPLLKAIFLSRDFYSPLSVATQIKSPVQLVVSTYRKMGLSVVPTVPDFSSLTGALGQSLFYPPNVAGWSSGRTWITPATLLQRGNLMRSVLLPPDLGTFGHPDRRMPGLYKRVGDRLAQGMNITAATVVGDSASNMLADADEDYNTRYGGYRGYVLAYERVKLIPRHSIDLDLRGLLESAGATTPEEVVDHFILRFLGALEGESRALLVRFAQENLGPQPLKSDDSAAIETALRSLLYLVLSTPEYQLG